MFPKTARSGERRSSIQNRLDSETASGSQMASINNSISQLKSSRAHRKKPSNMIGLESPNKKMKPRNSVMSSLNKLPKLQEDSLLLSACEDEPETGVKMRPLDLTHGLGEFSQAAVLSPTREKGGDLIVRQSIYERNHRELKRFKHIIPMTQSTRNYRSNNAL